VKTTGIFSRSETNSQAAAEAQRRKPVAYPEAVVAASSA
jgi:hypothetical protein